jgi:hypothetical protein
MNFVNKITNLFSKKKSNKSDFQRKYATIKRKLGEGG